MMWTSLRSAAATPLLLGDLEVASFASLAVVAQQGDALATVDATDDLPSLVGRVPNHHLGLGDPGEAGAFMFAPQRHAVPARALAPPAHPRLGNELALGGLDVLLAIELADLGDAQAHALGQGPRGDAGFEVRPAGEHRRLVGANKDVVEGQALSGAQRIHRLELGGGLRAADVQGADVAEGEHGVPRLALAALLVAAFDLADDLEARAAGEGCEALVRDPRTSTQHRLLPGRGHELHIAGLHHDVRGGRYGPIHGVQGSQQEEFGAKWHGHTLPSRLRSGELPTNARPSRFPRLRPGPL